MRVLLEATIATAALTTLFVLWLWFGHWPLTRRFRKAGSSLWDTFLGLWHFLFTPTGDHLWYVREGIHGPVRYTYLTEPEAVALEQIVGREVYRRDKTPNVVTASSGWMEHLDR